MESICASFGIEVIFLNGVVKGKLLIKLPDIHDSFTTQDADASTSTSEQQGDDAELEGQRDGGGTEHPSLEGKIRWVYARRARSGEEMCAPSLLFADPDLN